jgi:hypothetical protein
VALQKSHTHVYCWGLARPRVNPAGVRDCAHQRVEFWPGIFRAGLANVDIFRGNCQAPSGAVCPEVAQLQITALVFCADSGVYVQRAIGSSRWEIGDRWSSALIFTAPSAKEVNRSDYANLIFGELWRALCYSAP